MLVDATTLQVVSEFSTFVNPTGEKRGQLTAFCTKLTSITQEDVDGAPTLDKVLKQFEMWLPEVLGSHDTSRVLPVTLAVNRTCRPCFRESAAGKQGFEGAGRASGTLLQHEAAVRCVRF